MKKSGSFHITDQNIDCEYLLEPPREPKIYVFSRNKKINVYPSKPQFYCIKVGFKGSKLYRRFFVMCITVVYRTAVYSPCSYKN